MTYVENGLENASVPGQGLPVPMRAPIMAPSGSFQPQAPQINYFPPPAPFNANLSAKGNFVGSSNIAGAQPGCCGNCAASRPAIAPVNPPQYIPVPPVNNNINVPPMPSNYHFGVNNGPMQPSAVGISHPNQGMMGSCPVIRNYRNEARGYSAEPVDPMRFPPIQRSAPSAPTFLNSMLPAYSGFEVNQSGPFGQYPPPLHPGAGANRLPQFPIPVGQEFPKPPPANVSYGSHSMVPPMPVNAPFQGVVPPAPSRAPFVPLPGAPPAPKSSDDDLATQLGFLSINPANDAAKSTVITSRFLQETYDELYNMSSQISPDTKPFDTAATIITHAVRKHNLARPAEWRLSIRTHSFSGGISTKEHLLSNDDPALYEYSRYLHATKYPLFVLSYVGGGGPANSNGKSPEIPKVEVVWGLNNIEQEIHAVKIGLIRNEVPWGWM